ncbi:MAG: Alcohol dehydrogenase [uncultured Solirubrobacteraceae bacterium]|uniref:hydroxyacid-oxoacid transhydrogenase n=1 Tax=uncultured Solirubrobacteraceae bacterium TaxID=1162706 RepID=A0A6J4T0A3_9ACTN|nr:MAG: Alcohol dehydrogenase [uncultured Solirubrobacteraceae bacterium]
MAQPETVFTVEATPLKFGPGACAETAWELERLGVARPMVLMDPGVRAAGIADRVLDGLRERGIAHEVYDDIRVEPDEESFARAAGAARDGGYDGFLSIGGGSTIDTAKVANLLSVHGGEVMDYVNAPVGGGRKPPGPLKPHVAVPTTSGSGSEATTVAVLDVRAQGVKSGISHRFLRCTQAVVDPELTRSLPPEVTSSAGLDVVCHAAESFTAREFGLRERPGDPADRPPYQGANPVADVWSGTALEYGGRYLRRAVADGNDVEARGAMMLSASLAGIGFGSAGVHVPHACAYPIASHKHAYVPPGYPEDHPFIPHGHSVIVTAPAAFRFTYEAAPERHRRAAELLAGRPIPEGEATADTLPEVLASLMRDVGAPSGLEELGYDEADIPALVEGALKQQRLLVIAPREAGAEDLAEIFRASMRNW